MTSEENVLNEKQLEAATPKPLSVQGNLILTLKLLVGGGILGFLFWYLDSHITK